ncbi:MAG: DUF4252 domain-containing protein [Saprospiraceae bacterium]|nr:DUF4252 domain-containing protein [Saprospiraceae bacterium]
MKRIFISAFAFLMLAMTVQAQSDAISKHFKQYVDDERFSMIYISPKMFDLVSRIEIESDDLDPEVMEIVKELKGLRILTFEGDGAMGYYNEARKKIDANNFEELMSARGDENVYIAVNSSGDIVSELLLLVGDSNDFALMSFSGNIDLKKVGKLGKMLDLDGIEHLEKIEKH